jgi:hypothetical protein
LAASPVSQSNRQDAVAAVVTGLLTVAAASRRNVQPRGHDYGDPYGGDPF